MNFYINNFDGQLGNQILAYNNLHQLAYSKEDKIAITSKNELSKFFKNIYTFEGEMKGQKINGDMLRARCKIKKNIILEPPYLGDLFFFLTKKDPRLFFEIKDEYKVNLCEEKTNIAIHIRIPALIPNYEEWKKKNPYKARKNELLKDFGYVKEAIILCLEKFKNNNFIVFSIPSAEHFSNNEDKKLYSGENTLYSEVKEYFLQNKINWENSITMKDPNKSYFYDFSQMSECDVIIANPSTFSTCATFLGKKNKKVIYNESFLNLASKNSFFWKDLKNGGNEYYKIDYLI